MIRTDDLGWMLTVFALSYSDPLFETSRLHVKNRPLFRTHCRQAIDKVEPAHYDHGIFAWVFDRGGAARHFLSTYLSSATREDALALEWWFKNGYNGLYTPDLVSDLWHSSLHWAIHHDDWSRHIDPAVKERTSDLLRHIKGERRSEKHMQIVDNVRDHEDDESDLVIKSKSHLDFYDDFVDPLLLFTCMRGKFAMMKAISGSIDDKPLIEALNSIPAAWFADEGHNYPDHDYRGLLSHVKIQDLAHDYAWRN
jgi:hypothetical protein